MITSLSSRIGLVLNCLFLICVIAFAIGIAHNHFKLITHELPLDYNEGGMLEITSTIARGENPFSLENQPVHISVYPVLYNIAVAPFTRLFGNTLELHRVLAGLFILACCALCYYQCRRESGTPTDSFIAAALVYAGLIYYSTPIASPNSLGLFLFLAAITIPWVHGFSTRSLALTIVLGVLAFFTKQYFIACIGYVALYLFLAASKKRAIYFGITALAIFVMALAVVSYTSPYYLEDTFFAVQSGAEFASSDDQVILQFKEYSQIYLPLLVILFVATGQKLFSIVHVETRNGHAMDKGAWLNLLEFDKPLLRRAPNYIWLCCGCSVIIIVLALGKNRGNHLTYLFQLISPFMLVGTFALISKMPKWRWPFRFLILLVLYNSYDLLHSDFSVGEENWRTIRKEIAEADDIYASTLVLPEIIEKGIPIYNNGHTSYFIFGKNAPPLFIKSDPEQTVPEIWERHVEFIQSKIKNQEFDLIMLDHWMQLPTSFQENPVDTKVLLEKHYIKTGEMTLPLANRPGGGGYRVQIWKPGPVTPD